MKLTELIVEVFLSCVVFPCAKVFVTYLVLSFTPYLSLARLGGMADNTCTKYLYTKMETILAVMDRQGERL